MVFGAHNSWYFFVTPFGPSFMKKTFSIVKTKLSFRNLWDTKKVTTKKVILQNMITHQFNYYIIIHCQIGHVNRMLSFYMKYLRTQTSEKFKSLLPSSQCTPVKSMSLHSHAGPLSVDMQTPLFWQGFWWSQVLMVVDRTPCNNIFQKS